MKLNYFSLPSRFWRYVRIVTLSTVCIFALGVIGVSYGMWYADGIIRNATRDLNLGYPGEARYSLETLSSDSFHKLFLRLHLVDDEELMRVRCAASVSDAEYEQAVAVCTQALSYAHGSAIRNEIRFNRAAAYIRLTFLGMLPKGTLGRKQLSKLKVYGGPDHPHSAQKPEQ
ncbi:MAG: 50S ribosomal protein L13 [Parcubacteria group bacterium GW2011_GWA2_47_7]|nr:MAG: 50S ribosomal protein L13 [Parcubacteria group bacterium GW2011_GWA2_47_7]